ncbi:MAG: ABC transporter ATP-binding protein [Bacteroidaceae bacterium]|nr:ABC transporter ATP-binding protein [Bacteroidaceae bacterium]
MDGNTIILDNLQIGYTHNRQAMPVVGVIDAALHKGELVALVGRNGAGKSTLLRTLSAFQEPLAGSITYPDGKSHRRKAPELATQLAVVLTGNGGIHSLTVREVVAMGRVPYTGLIGHERRRDKEAVDAAMQAVGVGHLSERRIETLSDGERQKAMIAKALAQETPVIMLDEPTAFLDFGSRVQLFRLLQRLAHENGKSILVSTHDLELVLHLADRLWLIHDRKMYTGTVEALSDNGVLSSFIEADGIFYNSNDKRIEIR